MAATLLRWSGEVTKGREMLSHLFIKPYCNVGAGNLFYDIELLEVFGAGTN
jgi:hypothetical protein